MNSLKSTVLTLVAITVLLASSMDAEVCTHASPKPVHHVCGVVVDYQGSPIPEVQVTASRAGKEIVTGRTTDAGKVVAYWPRSYVPLQVFELQQP